MLSSKIVIAGDGQRAIECHSFFKKYGFDVTFFVSEKEESVLFNIPVFRFDKLDEDALAALGCPVIIATDDPVFRSFVIKRLQDAGIPEKLIVHQMSLYSHDLEKIIDCLSFNLNSKPNEYVKCLMDNYPESGKDPFLILTAYQSLKIRRSINNGKKTLGIFYPTCAYRENLGSDDMYDKIRQKGYNVVFLFGTICNDKFEKRLHSYYVGESIVRCLDFIDAFIIPTLMDVLPEKSRKILFVHDIWDSPKGKAEAPRTSPEGDPPRVSALIDELDYTFLPSTVVMPKNNISSYRRKKPLCRIPGGYIKLDRNIRYFENCKIPLDSIVYAPTVIGDMFANYVSVPEYGEKIIGALLDNFPNYNIIFRPHPHTLATDHVANIANRFLNNSRFVFDDNASFYMDNYCRSVLMVSDMSGTAFTYAFTTLRPVIFFSHNEKSVEEAFDKVTYFKDRNKIGYVVTNIDETIEKVSEGLKHINEFKEKIREFRDSTIFNAGRAEDYFVENFHYIMEDKKHPDWQYVQSP